MVLTTAEEVNRQQASRGGRFVRRESDARRDLERMHLMTVRREKMRLQQELEKVRVNKSNNHATNNAKLLSSRFGLTPAEAAAGVDTDGRRRLMIGTAKGARARSVSPNPSAGPRRTRTAGHLGGSYDHELPQIGFGPSPLKGELDMRKHTDELRDPNTKIKELKKNEGRQKSLLSLKVDRFTRSLSPVSSRRLSPVPSPSPKPTEDGDLFRFPASDRVPLLKSDSDVDARGSFPPSSRRKTTRDSIANLDLTDAKDAISSRRKTTRESIADLDIIDVKDAISRRLMTSDSDEGQNYITRGDPSASRPDDVLPNILVAGATSMAPPPALPRRPMIIRRESQAAILDRSDAKKNKYAVAQINNNSNTDVGQPNLTNAKKPLTKDDSIAKDITLSTLGGRDAKRVREIIENPEIVFDQEKYAPDGALRTVHMLPDADTAFGLARKARYLRWRDPDETNYEQELSIAEIFGNGK